MGGNNLFKVLFSTVKSKLSGLVSKLKIYTSWNFIQSKIVSKLRDFFSRLLDVRPKNKKDYFRVFGWLVSKRLAYALVIVIGVLSIWYLTSMQKVFTGDKAAQGMRTFRYNSVLLRMAEGNVRIKGKSGYLAYEGHVDKGKVNGQGTLYNPDAQTVYKGNFADSMYEGEGTTYYPNSNVHYEGTFHENLYEGEGILYREDGSTEYKGSFSSGMKNGEGILYGTASNPVYEGNFSYDHIVYTDLLGVETGKITECYSGDRMIYMGGGEFAVELSDIDAMYLARSDEENLDNSLQTIAVYVLSDEFHLGKSSAYSIDELKAMLGDPVYEGTSSVILPEAILINRLNETSRRFNGRVDMDYDATYNDVLDISSYDRDYVVYLYTFRRGEFLYRFICEGRDSGFEFYCIEPAK
jgi:hypothetical protein